MSQELDEDSAGCCYQPGSGVQIAHGTFREDIMNRRFKILIWCMQNKKVWLHYLKMCCFEHASWKFKSTCLPGHEKGVTKTKEM